MDEFIKPMVKVFPYIGGATVLLSIINAIIFYSFFGIRILDYLEFSESLFLFLDNILIVTIVGLIAFVVFLYFINKLMKNKAIKIEYAIGIETHKIKHPKDIKAILIFLCILLPLYNAISLIWFQKDIPEVILTDCFGVWAILMQIANLKMMNYFDKEKESKKYIPIYFLAVFASLFSFTVIIWNSRKAISIKYDHKNTNQTIFFKSGTTLSTSDSLLYIGQTKNFIFFYNPKNDEKTIIKLDELSKIQLK